jgi:hypothetical protein
MICNLVYGNNLYRKLRKVSIFIEFKNEEKFKNSGQTRQRAQEQGTYEIELKDFY